jgi:hypothetical protein
MRLMQLWLPLIISVVAVAFSGLQWFESHKQASLSFRPLVDFLQDDDAADSWVGIGITNNGSAPAILKSITYYVDGKSFGTREEASRFGNIPTDLVRGFFISEGDSLGAGKTEWLFSRQTKGQHGVDEFLRFIDERFAIGVVFCSMAGECWERCSVHGRCEH